MQQSSYLAGGGGALMRMLPLYLHVNQQSDDDDDDNQDLNCPLTDSFDIIECFNGEKIPV